MPNEVQQRHGATVQAEQSAAQKLWGASRRSLAAVTDARVHVTAGPLRRLSDRFGLMGLSFILCVLLPGLIGAFYVLALAPKEYVSEFRVVVHSGEEGPNLAALLSGAMASTASLLAPPSESSQNAFMVSDYVKSRNMIDGLGGKPRLYDIYSTSKGGWIAGLARDSSQEDVRKYWQGKLRTEIDSSSSVLTVQVRAFTRPDALALANDVIALSEKMVNDISDRSRADALSRALNEVDRAQSQVVAAHQALLHFRNNQQVLDPTQDATAISQLIVSLLKERMTLENDRAGMGNSVSAQSPVTRLMASRVADIDGQIAGLKAKLTSHSTGPAISYQLATYETLQLRNQFAEGMYKMSQSAYESAREAKERQQLYLMTVVKPALPDQALYPRRGADIFLIFGLCFIVWSIGALLTAAVLDHVT